MNSIFIRWLTLAYFSILIIAYLRDAFHSANFLNIAFGISAVLILIYNTFAAIKASSRDP